MRIIDRDESIRTPRNSDPWPVDKVHATYVHTWLSYMHGTRTGYGEMEKIDVVMVPTSSHSKQLKIRACVIMRGWAGLGTALEHV